MTVTIASMGASHRARSIFLPSAISLCSSAINLRLLAQLGRFDEVAVDAGYDRLEVDGGFAHDRLFPLVA
jgi:hypothetical protein